MTNAQLVALGIRLFCIWLAVFVLRHAPALWSANARQFADPSAANAIVIISVIFLGLIIVLWFFPLAVARKLVPNTTLGQPTSLPADQIQSVGFCLLGLWLLTEAIPRLVYICFIVYHSTRPNTMAAIEPHQYAVIAQTLVEFGIGFWLLFGARGLLGVIRWARHAGLAGTSNRVVESDARRETPRLPHNER